MYCIEIMQSTNKILFYNLITGACKFIQVEQQRNAQQNHRNMISDLWILCDNNHFSR